MSQGGNRLAAGVYQSNGEPESRAIQVPTILSSDPGGEVEIPCDGVTDVPKHEANNRLRELVHLRRTVSLLVNAPSHSDLDPSHQKPSADRT
jgi:hypothetical protein